MSIQNGYDILVLGNPFCDRSVNVNESFLEKHQLEKGLTTVTDQYLSVKNSWEDARSSNDTWSLGGSGMNVSKTLAHLSHRCAIYGKIGSDSLGEEIEERLHKLGVASILSKGANQTGIVNCFITSESHRSERTMHTYLGAATEFSDNEIVECYFNKVQHVHVEGYASFFGNSIGKTVEFAKKNHATTSLDLASKSVIERNGYKFKSCLGEVDYIFGNLEEIQALTFEHEVIEAVKKFKLNQLVVVTQGAEGCWVKPQGSFTIEKFAALSVANVVDTTGAGDFFEAGFLHGIFQKRPIFECVHMGNLAASYVIQERGADMPEEKWLQLVNNLKKI